MAKAALRYCTCVVLPSEADGTCYADIADALNAGNTAPFIYSGWENTIVTTGLKMLDFMEGNATMEDVIRQLDEDQDSVVNNTPDTITTVTEELSQEDCAMLVGPGYRYGRAPLQARGYRCAGTDSKTLSCYPPRK